MKDLRVGFFGAGGINGVHAKAVQKLPGTRVTALYNHNRARAETFNADRVGGAAKVFDDFDQMLAADLIDVMYVAIPPGAHNGEVERAAAKGIHLMLEKPIALTMERADSIAAAVRKAGVVCQIGHHMRHSAPVRKLKQMIVDGSAGRSLMMQGRFFTNGLFPAWWRNPKLGGGQLIEQSIHIYDIARHFLGEPAIVTAFADNLIHQRFPDYQVDDASAATVRFHDGAIASICAANIADPQHGSITFTVMCEKVMAEFRNPTEATFVHHGGRVGDELKGVTIAREDVSTPYNMYDELSANFIGAIRGEQALRSTVDDGTGSLRLVLAAAESARANGSPRFVPEK